MYWRSFLVTPGAGVSSVAASAASAGRSRAASPVVAGTAAWLVAVVLLPAPLAARISLLAPLVIVPAGLRLLPPRLALATLAGWPALLAATPLLIAFALPPGPLAAAFAAPWAIAALFAAIIAVEHGARALPWVAAPRRLPDLGIDIALGCWFVGATFLVIDRLGVATPFPQPIVLLTATHFHFAGFGLLLVASLLGIERRRVRPAVLGLIVGIPLTALGFVVGANAINALGALIVGTSGIVVAIALLTAREPARRWRSRVAGLALLVGMPLGIAWSLAILTGQPFIGLDGMIRTHGALNAVGVLTAIAGAAQLPDSWMPDRP